MSETLETIKNLAAARKVRISDHGIEELFADGITLKDVLESLPNARVVEDYPTAFKGPTVLAHHNVEGREIHVVWGLAKHTQDVATIVTAYVPDLEKWYDGFMLRKSK